MFKIDQEKKEAIIGDFGITKDNFKTLYSVYEKIREGMKDQYLAHMIRTMEVQLQALTGNPFFKINVKPMSSPRKELTASCASYMPKKGILNIS